MWLEDRTRNLTILFAKHLVDDALYVVSITDARVLDRHHLCLLDPFATDTDDIRGLSFRLWSSIVLKYFLTAVLLVISGECGRMAHRFKLLLFKERG